MMRRLRRMLGRAALDDDEVQILLGVARQMRWAGTLARRASSELTDPRAFIIVGASRDEPCRNLTPTGAVDLVERQVRRVRRRKNLYELQRTVYLAIAAARGRRDRPPAVRALRPTRVFATVAVGALALTAGIAMVARRRTAPTLARARRALSMDRGAGRPRWARADPPRARCRAGDTGVLPRASFREVSAGLAALGAASPRAAQHSAAPQVPWR